MSWAVTAAVIGSAVAGAASSAYSASEANKNVQQVDPAYKKFVNQIAQNDASSSEWASNLYQYGSIDPYEGQGFPVTPYKTADSGKNGYYYDKYRGVYVDEAAYQKYSNSGKKSLDEQVYRVHDNDPNTPARQSRFEWHEAASPATEGGYGALEEKKIATQLDMYDDLVDYARRAITEESEILSSRYDAEQAGLNETIQTSEGKISATNAANKYVSDTTPYKTEADIAKYQYDTNLIGMKTPVMSEYFSQAMEGIDPKESMDSATAEVMKANDATKAGMQRDAMAMGIAPGSEKYNAMMQDDRNATVGAIADARTAARKQAEDTSFDRLSAAMNQS